MRLESFHEHDIAVELIEQLARIDEANARRRVAAEDHRLPVAREDDRLGARGAEPRRIAAVLGRSRRDACA